MDKVISTLNTLLETTKDGEKGFRTCAGAVNDPHLKAVFEDAAKRCDEGAAELQAKIRSLGKEPTSSGTATGALHRAWTNIKSSTPAWTNMPYWVNASAARMLQNTYMRKR